MYFPCIYYVFREDLAVADEAIEASQAALVALKEAREAQNVTTKTDGSENLTGAQRGAVALEDRARRMEARAGGAVFAWTELCRGRRGA